MIARFLRKYPLLIASLLLLGFNTALIAMRIAYSHRLYYVFLMWNLFLAVIPFLFMELGRLLYNRKKILWASWSLFFLSLLFLPNSPYIITDLFHLKPRHSVPFWYDTLMIFSFATTGVVFFFATLKSMYRFLKHFSQPLVAQLSISLIIYLCAFGVYLGRYLRFNSWDILTHPGYLFSQIFERILFPLDHPKTWAMTLVYGTLLCLGWMLMNLLGDKQETRALR